jgi:hypothetical protein
VVDAALALVTAAPAGWPFPFSPVAAAALALAVVYAAALLAPTTPE